MEKNTLQNYINQGFTISQIAEAESMTNHRVRFLLKKYDLSTKGQKKKPFKRPCLVCDKETTNPKFCSSSCAAKYNNEKSPKRKLKIALCTKCGCEIKRKSWKDRRTLCDGCSRGVDWDNITLEQLSVKTNTQKYSRVRDHARKVFHEANPSATCYLCGYSKHVEVCHIKPINTFSLDTKVSVINHKSNLIGLCRNHHWELDHNLLDPPDLKRVEDYKTSLLDKN